MRLKIMALLFLLSIPWLLFDCTMSNFRFYRWLRGGHWECWHTDHSGAFWHRLERCTQTKNRKDSGERLGMGRPTCEEYGK